MYNTTQNKLFIITALLAITLSTPLSASFAQSTPRVSRNEYDLQFPQHAIKLKVEASDLTKINPSITFCYKTDSQNPQSIWTTPWDTVGALGALITIFYCNSDHPYVVAAQGTMSVLTPLLPRLYNYITKPKTTAGPNEHQE